MSSEELIQYEEFVRRKNRRPLIDAYSCFQPFNEATKAFFPFIELIRKQLKPGDTILNLWDRSGWFTSLLAGLFPEQSILTIWEGDRDVLGYKGYAFWFSGPEAPANVQVLFHDLHQPLPLPDRTIALVVGMDVLHRHDLSGFLSELARVLQPEGGMLFPHVHLANAEPEPYFKRGGQLRTGLDYEQQIVQLSQLGNYQAFVFSEPDLFRFNTTAPMDTQLPLESTPNTPDYNALIAILPAAWTVEPLRPFRAHEAPDWTTNRVLLNNLLAIDYTSGRVHCQHDRMGGMVGHLLERHPVFETHIRASDGYILSETALCFLYWAARQLTVTEIAVRLGLATDELQWLVNDLAGRDLIQLVPVSAAGARLQHYLSFQTYEESYAEQTLPRLWSRAVSLFGNRTAFVSLDDDSSFSYADADQIISQLRSALHKDGLRPGDRVLIRAPLHVESLLLSWACWQSGLVIVPISPDLPIHTQSAIAELVQPSLMVTVADGPAVGSATVPVIWLDTNSASDLPTAVRWFTDWAVQELPVVEPVACRADDRAAILFTSGSTGQPKGVPLTHGQLCRSSRLVTETFKWTKEDRFLAVGNLDSMSGLRNSTSAAVDVGAAVIVPAPIHRQSGSSMSEAVAAGQASVLTASPSLLRQWVQYDRRVAMHLRSLRLVMSTGSSLTIELRRAFKKTFSLTIVNYYGLTETTGICLAEYPDQVDVDRDTIGWPVGCLAQVVDTQQKPVAEGEVGELRIYSENNLTASYMGQLAELPVKPNWLYTGDLAAVNPNGSFTLLGRQSDRIKNAHSEIVYVAEVETLLLTHPAVADAAVCSFMRHDTEALAAFLTINGGQDSRAILADLSAHLLERMGARKLPAVFRILDEIPRTAGGKISKQTLLSLLTLE